MTVETVDERPYAVFVSYSRKDNVGGWVTTLLDALRQDSQRLGERGYRIFFDVNEVKSFEEWKGQLQRALRQSQVLMVCVSQRYYESEPCLWEWLEHEARSTAPDFPVAVVPVFLEDTADDHEADQKHKDWRAKVYKVHGRLDLRQMFTLDPTEVSADELTAQVRALGDELHQRREAVRRWESTGTNMPRGTQRFVGRSDEMSRLGEAITSAHSIGVVTAVQGLGGIGKTELVRQYAWRNRAAFPGGVWQLAAENQTEILPLLATLTHDLDGFTISDEAEGTRRRSAVQSGPSCGAWLPSAGTC